MGAFTSADILIPSVEDISKWSVIACDQFTSQQEYWDETAAIVGDAPSSLNLILPEVRLPAPEGAAEAINEKMDEYLRENIFTCYESSFVYIERGLRDGSVRRGILGCIDLDEYEFGADSSAAVRATEKTVIERLPPRVAIRRDAPLELPHILLLCDDSEDLMLGWCENVKNSLPVVYDFDLMQGGGHIRGYLVTGDDAQYLRALERQYCSNVGRRYASMGKAPLYYAAGDGNHSLATAKTCWEELKKAHPGEDLSSHPAKYALVELDNIHDDSQKFEAIHRIVCDTDTKALVEAMRSEICRDDGVRVEWFTDSESGELRIDCSRGELPIAVVQSFLDRYLARNAGKIDYIHDRESVIALSGKPDTLGLVLPAIEKSAFFRGIVAGGVLPRKTFSMGHAVEKRYYLEARKIK